MDKTQVLKRAQTYVRTLFENEGTGHDWWHLVRVRNMALRLCEETPGADTFIVELAAWLHDVGDHKFHDGDFEIGPKMVGEQLRLMGAEPEVVGRVMAIVTEVSFKGAGVPTPVSSLESAIVQDADRLDAMGAIGIARVFAYGGSKGSPLWDPEEKPVLHSDSAAYAGSKGSSVNHFYEKLLLLRDRLNTDAAKSIAGSRHAFMLEYLNRFYKEWDGEW